MSWCDRRSLTLCLAALTLAGCGFSPMLAPGSPGHALMGWIEMEPPESKPAFDLVERLEERLGRGTAPDYRLSYQISLDELGLGVTPEGATTRYNLDGSATYTLLDLTTGAVTATGRVESFTSWPATGSTLSTVTAEEDARRRLMHILADQIVTRLLAGV